MSLDHNRTPFQGSSAAAERLRLQVQRFAPHFRTVFLVGETGAGKESVGRELHRLSPAGEIPFCVVDLEDFVAGAGAGTVIYLQGLVRARTDAHDGLIRRLNALGRETRLIVPCEGEPRALLAVGRLRADVLERVGMLEIRVPALRERREDLESLTASILAALSCDAGFSDAQLKAMQSYRWPGNLAELWTACERFSATGELELPAPATTSTACQARPEEIRLEQVIERHVMDVLERCAGNKLKAAELLGISRSTLYRMLEASGQAHV